VTRAVSLTLPRHEDESGTRVGSAGAAVIFHGLIVALMLAVPVPAEPGPGVTGWTLDANTGGGGGRWWCWRRTPPPSASGPTHC